MIFTPSAWKDAAARVITTVHREVLRRSGGRLFATVVGMPTVILTTTGRRSGAPRTTMLTAPVIDGDTVVLVASYGGDDRHPNWYRNLLADPAVHLEIRGIRRAGRARPATPEERAALWPRVVAAYRGYEAYQRRTDREIPLVLVELQAEGRPPVHPPTIG